MLSILVAFAATAHAEAQKKGGLPQLHLPDFAPQLIWLALTFGVLYLVLSRMLLPKIGSAIEDRACRIKRDLDEADRLKAETERALAAYEKRLAEARGNASALAKETSAKLSVEAEQERSRVETQLATKLREAETRIAATKSRALASVTEIAAGTAGAIVARLIGHEPSPDEIRKALQTPAGE